MKKKKRFEIYYKAVVPGAEWKIGISTSNSEEALQFVCENIMYFRLYVLDRKLNFCFGVLRPDELDRPELLKG